MLLSKVTLIWMHTRRSVSRGLTNLLLEQVAHALKVGVVVRMVFVKAIVGVSEVLKVVSLVLAPVVAVVVAAALQTH